MASPSSVPLIPEPLLRDHSRLESLPKGTVLYRAGDPSASFFIIESGLVRVQKQLRGDHPFLSIMRPGETVGEQTVVSTDPRDATAETLSQCTLWEVRRSDFIDAAGAVPDLWNWLALRLRDRLAQCEHRLHHVTHDRVPERIMALVGGLSSADREYRLPLTQWDVALLVGATRETTSTALNQLERLGKVKLGRGFIQFLNLS